MNTKIIIALITFCTTFGFSAGLTKLFVGSAPQPAFSYRKQTDNAPRREILSLLDSDIRNGRLRDRKIFAAGNPFESDAAFRIYVVESENYANSSAALDDSDLPADLQAAWREHMQVWAEHSRFLKETATLNNAEAMRVYRQSDREITRTWFNVLRTAARYGAYPANAY